MEVCRNGSPVPVLNISQEPGEKRHQGGRAWRNLTLGALSLPACLVWFLFIGFWGAGLIVANTVFCWLAVLGLGHQ